MYLNEYQIYLVLMTLKHAESIKGINMSDFKPQLKIVTMAVAVAISGLMIGCNDNSSEKATVKDDAYYKSLAEQA
jgi:hypothetical protein